MPPFCSVAHTLGRSLSVQITCVVIHITDRNFIQNTCWVLAASLFLSREHGSLAVLQVFDRSLEMSLPHCSWSSFGSDKSLASGSWLPSALPRTNFGMSLFVLNTSIVIYNAARLEAHNFYQATCRPFLTRPYWRTSSASQRLNIHSKSRSRISWVRFDRDTIPPFFAFACRPGFRSPRVSVRSYL